MSRKRSLVVGETNRANKVSSNPTLCSLSLANIKNRFLNNGYPSAFTEKNCFDKYPKNISNVDPITYIKIPFISKIQKAKILRLAKFTSLKDQIRFIFTTCKPLAWQFRAPREKLVCGSNCLSCETSLKEGLCFVKNAVYLISCKLCDKVYVGQSSRCAGSRINEHIKNPTSFVFSHMQRHGTDCRTDFEWSILATCAQLRRRLAIEALYIEQYKNKLINDNKGTDLLNFIM